MPDFAGSGIANRSRRYGPYLASFLITQVECFGGTVRDRVVRPCCETVLAAVYCPSIPPASFAYERAEVTVGENVAPRSRRRLPGFDEDDIFAAIRREPTQTIVVEKVR